VVADPRLLRALLQRRFSPLWMRTALTGISRADGVRCPRVVPVEPEGSLAMTRPPTRFLIIGDPEGKMATAAGRDQRRGVWVQRLLDTMPIGYRDEVVRGQLDHLVFVETWNRVEDAFEFAHFTPRQIAAGLQRVRGAFAAMTLAEVQEIVERVRVGGSFQSSRSTRSHTPNFPSSSAGPRAAARARANARHRQPNTDCARARPRDRLAQSYPPQPHARRARPPRRRAILRRCRPMSKPRLDTRRRGERALVDWHNAIAFYRRLSAEGLSRRSSPQPTRARHALAPAARD